MGTLEYKLWFLEFIKEHTYMYVLYFNIIVSNVYYNTLDNFQWQVSSLITNATGGKCERKFVLCILLPTCLSLYQFQTFWLHTPGISFLLLCKDHWCKSLPSPSKLSELQEHEPVHWNRASQLRQERRPAVRITRTASPNCSDFLPEILIHPRRSRYGRGWAWTFYVRSPRDDL